MHQNLPRARSGARGTVRPDMRYCFRSGRFRPNPRTKHISVPPRHMTKPYAPDFQHDITTLQIQDTTSHTSGIQLPQIQYNSGRYMSEYRLQSNAYWQKENIDPITTRVQALR